jgi:hypothetical protein
MNDRRSRIRRCLLYLLKWEESDERETMRGNRRREKNPADVKENKDDDKVEA